MTNFHEQPSYFIATLIILCQKRLEMWGGGGGGGLFIIEPDMYQVDSAKLYHFSWNTVYWLLKPQSH